ncbi:MAG: histidinol-phosphatase HisJ family protein [Lachnospiraceae bacterium]
MISSDYHVHTSFSTDSDAHPREVVEAAIQQGIKDLCITDHMDCEWPEDHNSFIFDVKEYFDTLSSLRTEYKNQLNLHIGMELGLRNEPDIYSLLRPHYESLSKEPFDFIIGSTHVFDYGDPYYSKFWEDRDPEDRINEYFEATLFNAENYDSYDVYGHLDYVIRYMPDGFHYDQNHFSELIEAILKTIIHKGKGIEINTSSLDKCLMETNPNASVIEMYRNLGGEIITIGSDSHSPKTLCSHFSSAADILKECGFEYYTIFRNRKPEFIKL